MGQQQRRTTGVIISVSYLALFMTLFLSSYLFHGIPQDKAARSLFCKNDNV